MMPPAGWTTQSLRAYSATVSSSRSDTVAAPRSPISFASSPQAIATGRTRIVGPNPASDFSSAARPSASVAVSSPNGR